MSRARLLQRILTTLGLGVLIGAISGCAGVLVSKPSVEKFTLGQNSYHHPYELMLSPPTDKAPIREDADGSKTYVVESGWQWCGVNMALIIPIPLVLPVCPSKTLATYKPDKSVLFERHHWNTSVGYMCAPFVAVFGSPPCFTEMN